MSRSVVHRFKRGLAASVAVAALVASLAVPASPAYAQFGGGIVYDPAAVGQLIQQVSNQALMLNNMVQQLQQGSNMLQGLGTNLVPGLSGMMQQTRSLVGNLQGIQQSSATLSGMLQSEFPTDYSSFPDSQSMLGTVGPMLQQVRDAQEQSMTLQNQLAANIPQYSDAIQTGVDASNNAAGPTAALQATNQILAAMSAQLSDVLSALLAHERAEEQRDMGQAASAQAAQAAWQKQNSTPVDDGGALAATNN